MPKRGHNKPKAGTATVKGTITKEQEEVVENLVGLLGSNKQDVVGKIITLWLYNEGFLKNFKLNTKENRKNAKRNK